MGNPSMNNSVPDQERSVIELGFNNVTPENKTSMPTVPYRKSAPLVDAVTVTSNTTKIQVGPTASDITRRNR